MAKVGLLNLSNEANRTVKIHLYALRDAPGLKKTRFKIKSNQPFGSVIDFLRKALKLKETDGLSCYIGNFAPAPDEGVGGLWNVSIT
jgi:hypothetical protein